MINRDQRGSLVLPLILVSVVLLFALGFGFWAFTGMQDYKNNSDAKSAEAAQAAVEQNTLELEAEFAEESKSPNKKYSGPSAYGSLTITYPKTWSAYVDEAGKSSSPLNGYMHPDFVPVTTSTDINYALRFEVVNSSYDQELNKFSSQVKLGSVSLSAFRAPKVPGVLGSKITGEIGPQKQGAMVVFPLRDKTIKVWTEGNQFIADFNKIVENLTFVP